MNQPLSVLVGEALEVAETPFGTVGTIHAGREIHAWWIRKEREEIDPEWTTFDRDDLLFVVQGCLKLDLSDGDDVVLEVGDAFVIPAGTAFRGYRWPRESDDPCVFLAVSSADVATVKGR